jgi:beta-glucosidase
MTAGGSVTVRADVTNTGAVAGDEIVELYVGARNSSVLRAVRDLKGFERIHLTPGQTETVSFTLRAQDLAYYNATQSAWVVEPIDYVVSMGTNSRNLPLAATVKVTR